MGTTDASSRVVFGVRQNFLKLLNRDPAIQILWGCIGIRAVAGDQSDRREHSHDTQGGGLEQEGGPGRGGGGGEANTSTSRPITVATCSCETHAVAQRDAFTM